MTRVAALQRELAPFVGAAERSCIVGVHVELSGTWLRMQEQVNVMITHMVMTRALLACTLLEQSRRLRGWVWVGMTSILMALSL